MTQESSTRTSRRDFLKLGTVSAGVALAGGLSVARSAHALASDQLKVALIGCGNRGRGAAADCLTADAAVRVVAVADAFERQAKTAAELLKQRFAERADIPPDRVFCGLDSFQKAIDCGVDMVILTSPPGFRPMQYAAAIKAGKHVFMEKPCCVDAPGFRSLMETNKLADQKKCKVVVGLQRRHDESFIQGIREIHDGKIGKVLFLRAYWNGGLIWVRRREDLAKLLGREPTEMEYQVHNWYHFCWLSGDNICEQHVHNLDVCNWVMNGHPVEANGMGGCQARYLGENKGVGQIFDHHFVEFTYADGTKLFSQCRHMNGCWGGEFQGVHGTAGTSDCRGGPAPEPGARKPVAPKKVQRKAERKPDKKLSAEPGAKPRLGATVQEHVDLIAAIRKDEPHNEGYYGATSSMTAVLGRMATYSGQIVKWDEAVEKGTSEFPATLAWDAKAPVERDQDGNYPIPIPGVFKPY